MLHGGCWIFLSHSSHDIEKVRLVRNEFERLGHNPLAFHLKCLSTDTEEGRHELDSLIKREIDAREWFVFCDSPAAEQSPYVRDEHAYIIESGKENVWTIDMTADIDVILNKVRKICTDIEVFVSYVWKDREKAQSLIRALVKKDYSVWTPDDALTNGGDSYRSDISDAITRCAYKGFFVILITPDSVSSSFVAQELAAAYSQGASIIPVVLGNPLIPDNIDYYIRDVQRITVRTENDFAQVVDMLNSYVKENIMNNS